MGFGLATPSDASNPKNWETQGSTPQRADVQFTGIASGSYIYSSHLDIVYNNFTSKMTSASVDSFSVQRGFDLSRDAPPFLLELMKQPGRISMGQALSYRHGWDPLTVTIAAPVPIPEPTTLALFGVVIGGCLIPRLRRR